MSFIKQPNNMIPQGGMMNQQFNQFQSQQGISNPMYQNTQPGMFQQQPTQFQPQPQMNQFQPMNQQPNMFQPQPQNSFNQQPSIPKFNLLGPVNQGAVDKGVEDAVKAHLMSVKNDIDKTIVKLLTEHQSRRENINSIFSNIDFKGVLLDVAYMVNQPMCPSFKLFKQIKTGANGMGNNMFGQGVGQGLSINGVSVAKSAVNEYTEDGDSKRMNAIINAFLNIINLINGLPLTDSFEIRTPSANIDYIATSGMLVLTPSTLILNNNKNDARKLASKL